jgi:CHAT domain-containing protein
MAGVYRDFFQFEEALTLYAQAQSIFRDINAPLDEAITLNEMGFLDHVLGQQEDALRNYNRGIELVEASFSDLLQPGQAATFLDDQIQIYLRTVNLLADTEAWTDAFHVTEQARARSFLRQLAGSSLTSANGVAVVKEAQQIKNERAALARQLQQLRTAAPEARSDADNAAIAGAEAELEAIDRAFAKFCDRLEQDSLQDAALLCRTDSTLDDIQASLDADTALLSYFFTTDRVLAFVVGHNSFHAMELPVDEDDLRAQIIDGFRGDDLSITSVMPASIGPLYDALVRPVEPYLQAKRLGIVPHDVLHYLSFAALFDGEQYFGDRYSLFTLPSASALIYAQGLRKPAGDAPQALVLGNPTRDLFVTEEQVQSVAARYATAPLLRGQATETSFRSRSSAAALIHVAAHGTYDAADPLRTALQLAPDAQNDGRLEVGEIYTLDLHRATNLVVLSACESNINDLRTQRSLAVSPGDEVISLSRAFLYAGAPAVIASLWAVNAQPTNLLVDRFYTHLNAGAVPAEALQQAQIDVRASYPHPYFWAGFVVIGDPGGNRGVP